MILPVVKTTAAMMLVALAAMPARADVLEIGTGGNARWIAGPLVAPEVAPEALLVPDEPLPEVLSLVPEGMVANLAAQAGLVPSTYAAKVAELAERFDLSPALIEALVWQESRWRTQAVSPVGARGLAQLMPATARELGVDANDPFANLEGGARYLRQQMDRFDGNLEKALAAYNAGPGRVIRAGGIPAIRETQLYVAAIMGRLSTHSRSSD